MGGPPKIGVVNHPKWMVKIMENPIKMDDLGVPLFLETPKCWWQPKFEHFFQSDDAFMTRFFCSMIPWNFVQFQFVVSKLRGVKKDKQIKVPSWERRTYPPR